MDIKMLLPVILIPIFLIVGIFIMGSINNAVPTFHTALATPTGLTASTLATGTLNGTYFYKVSAGDGSGWTTLSSEVNKSVDGGVTTGTIKLTWNAVDGASIYRVWRGNAADNETAYNDTTSLTLSDTGSLTFTTATPPTTTNAYKNKAIQNAINNVTKNTSNGFNLGSVIVIVIFASIIITILIGSFAI